MGGSQAAQTQDNKAEEPKDKVILEVFGLAPDSRNKQESPPYDEDSHYIVLYAYP